MHFTMPAHVNTEKDHKVEIKEELVWVEVAASSSFENDELVPEMAHLKEETQSELAEPGRTQEPCADIKDELIIEEHSVDGLDPWFIDESNSSEETLSSTEMDVVSVDEKQIGELGGVNGSTTLPNNPSARDCQHLQQMIASAISAASRQQQPNSIPLRIYIGDKTIIVRRAPVCMDKKCKSVSSRGPSNGVQHAEHQYHKSDRRGSSQAKSDFEPYSCEKRTSRKDTEKRRRMNLCILVEGLRVLVPEVEDNKRAAQVLILKKAVAYCHELTEQNKALIYQVLDLQEEQERLLARVSHLSANLYSH